MDFRFFRSRIILPFFFSISGAKSRIRVRQREQATLLILLLLMAALMMIITGVPFQSTRKNKAYYCTRAQDFVFS
jgi:Kef-type K+ transport system membrane component KefB